MKSIGIKFPFKETFEGGVIGFTETDNQRVRSNLISFLTTKRGHRVMQNSLYSPLFDYIMEPWDEITETNLTSDLNNKLGQYFPGIDINEISYDYNEEKRLLTLKIDYTIINTKANDIVEITLAMEN
jgi:phage baseplate assembly protein W